jgi:hypothetical protein
MQSQRFEHSALKPAPYLLTMGSYAIPALHAPVAETVRLRRQGDCRTNELFDSPHFLRGFCWALVIEGLTGFFAYEVWRLWLLLR